MSEQQQLFDPDGFDDGRKKRKVGQRRTNRTDEAVPWEEPWLILTNRAGKVGFHLPRILNNGYNSTVAFCGFVGRPISQPRQHDLMVPCKECVADRDS